MTVRAALYLRVSTDEQVEKFGLPSQRRDLVEHAVRQGWEYEIYEDAGISGETLDARPAMLRLLQDVGDRRIDVVVAVELERFSRDKDLIDWLVIKQTFRKAGVKFGTPAKLYDLDNLQDDLMTDFMGVMSKNEKLTFLRRTRDGKLEAARQGLFPSGRPSYGYRAADQGASPIIFHEHEIAIARLIFELALESNGVRLISQELYRRSIPSPSGSQRWNTTTLLRILHNPICAGTAYYNRKETASARALSGKRHSKVLRVRPASEWIPIPVPAIISKEIFAQVQEQIRKNFKGSRRNRRRFYLLSGLVRCGECGRTLSGHSNNNIKYYESHWHPRCSFRSIRAEILEALVWDWVTRIVEDPDRVLEEARRWRESHVSDRDEMEIRLAAVQAELARIPEARGRIIRAYREEWISREESKNQLLEIDRKRVALEAEHQALTARLIGTAASEGQAVRLHAILERVRRRLQSLTLDERFEVVHAFIERVTVYGTGAIEIHAFVKPSHGSRDHTINCEHFLGSTWSQTIPVSAGRWTPPKPGTSDFVSALREASSA